MNLIFFVIDLDGANSAGSINFRSGYKALIQTNAQDISDPSNLEFPGSFDSYLGTFNSYYNGDLCAAYYKSKAPTKLTGKIHETFSDLLTLI